MPVNADTRRQICPKCRRSLRNPKRYIVKNGVRFCRKCNLQVTNVEENKTGAIGVPSVSHLKRFRMFQREDRKR